MSSPSDTPELPHVMPVDAARRRRRVRKWAEAQTPSYAAEFQPGVMRLLGPGFRHTPRAVSALVIREMSTTYGRSPLGYLWAILEPVAGIMLLTLIFSFAFRLPPIGTSFALFYASGVLPFSAYSGITGKIAQALRFSRALLFYPRVTFLDAIIGRLLLNTLTNAMVMIVLFTLIINVYKLDVILDIPAMVLSFAMTICLATGVGTVNCYLFATFPTWQLIWGVVNRPLFIMSGILFVYDAIPEPYRGWLWWNPLIHVIGQMRKGVYPTYDGGYVSPVYVFGLSGALTMVGLLLLRRYHRDIVNA
jgi:capsular polysaccharide transport system permease protein